MTLEAFTDSWSPKRRRGRPRIWRGTNVRLPLALQSLDIGTLQILWHSNQNQSNLATSFSSTPSLSTSRVALLVNMLVLLWLIHAQQKRIYSVQGFWGWEFWIPGTHLLSVCKNIWIWSDQVPSAWASALANLANSKEWLSSKWCSRLRPDLNSLLQREHSMAVSFFL